MSGIRLGIGLGVAFFTRLFGGGGVPATTLFFGQEEVAWGAESVVFG